MIKLEVLDLCSYCSLFESQGDDKGPVEAGGTEVAIIIILCQHAPPPNPYHAGLNTLHYACGPVKLNFLHGLLFYTYPVL